MTNKEVLNFIEFWLRDLYHVGHKDVNEKRKILKIIRREIHMGLDMGMIQENDQYLLSGMAKLMGERYPELRIRNMNGETISPNPEENGLKDIITYIEKHPAKVLYADYLHWDQLVKYFAIRKIHMPIDTVLENVKMKSNISFKDGKFILKPLGADK